MTYYSTVLGKSPKVYYPMQTGGVSASSDTDRGSAGVDLDFGTKCSFSLEGPMSDWGIHSAGVVASDLTPQSHAAVIAVNDNFSVSFWMRAMELKDFLRVMQLGDLTTGSPVAILINAAGNLGSIVQNVAFQNFGSTALSTHTWYNVGFVRASGTFKIYINGVLELASGGTGACLKGDGVLRLGDWGIDLCHVAYWESVLTLQDFADIYAARGTDGAANSTGVSGQTFYNRILRAVPKVYLPLQEIAGSTAALDASGNALDFAVVSARATFDADAGNGPMAGTRCVLFSANNGLQSSVDVFTDKTQWTQSFWVKIGAPANYLTLSLLSTDSQGWATLTDITPNLLGVVQNVALTTGAAMGAGWHHVAVRASANANSTANCPTFYVDGVKAGVSNHPTTEMTAPTGPYNLGGASAKMAHFAHFSRALAPSEIFEIYAARLAGDGAPSPGAGFADPFDMGMLGSGPFA